MESKKKDTVKDSVHVTTTSTVENLAAQAQIYFTSRTPTTNDSSEASVASQKAPKHQNAIGRKVEATNIKAVSRSSLVKTQDAIKSTEPTQRDAKPAESDVPRSQPAGKPLRERQLLPLPHFGAVIPPPAEFAGYSGKGDATLTRDSNKGYCMDALKLCQIYWKFSEVFKTSKGYIIFIRFFTAYSSNTLYIPLAAMTVRILEIFSVHTTPEEFENTTTSAVRGLS